MRNHALEIYVQSDNTALCFICSPEYGECEPVLINPVQTMTFKDASDRIKVAVHGRKISIDDAKRIARQAIERNFETLGYGKGLRARGV